MKSFSFGTSSIFTLTTGGSELKQWQIGNNHYWQAFRDGLSSFIPTGFRSIDIYGVDVVGNVQTQANIGIDGVIVNDWSIDVQINGNQPLIGADIVGGTYALDPTITDNRIFALGKYTNSVKFASPYSTASISLTKLRASGIGFQTAGSINLYLKLNFVVFYKFEGE